MGAYLEQRLMHLAAAFHALGGAGDAGMCSFLAGLCHSGTLGLQLGVEFGSGCVQPFVRGHDAFRRWVRCSLALERLQQVLDFGERFLIAGVKTPAEADGVVVVVTTVWQCRCGQRRRSHGGGGCHGFATWARVLRHTSQMRRIDTRLSHPMSDSGVNNSCCSHGSTVR